MKYRQSIAFHIIYIGGQFSVACEEKDVRKSHKSPFIIVINIMMCSLDVNFSVVHATASDKGQERRQVWERVVSFAACLVCGLSAYNLCSTAENNGQEQRQAW